MAASNVVSAIFDRITQLKYFPNSGALEPKLKKFTLEYRFLVVYTYKIIYRLIDKNTVIVLDVFPCKKDPVEIPFRIKAAK